jgi:hypothetical protein
MAFTTQQVHNIITAKLTARSNDQLIEDARVARTNKEDEAQRMIFALAMDVLATRLSVEAFETLYEELTEI